ncbi:MarR family transcriptional regulator [Microtetraspora malaysiensis]|uniref:MarR family transcriptional regulator n=1 Tax=Microtetraspora malaysiensis TaxID=161358 RepID=UPI003D9291F0
MSSIESPESGDAARNKRRLASTIKDSLRELSVELSMLNHQVSAHLSLKDVDLGCLDLLVRQGPMSPSALARRAGLHPATLTGILDRLERGGWVVRERDQNDRRSVVVRALRDRNAEVFHLFSGMNAAMDEICDRYDEKELALLADFLRRATSAGQVAADDLAGG